MPSVRFALFTTAIVVLIGGARAILLLGEPGHRPVISRRRVQAMTVAVAVAPSPVAPVSRPATAAAVGPLFGPNGRHHCTASAVTGAGGNLLITAAHCIYAGGSYRTGLVFAPGYLAGRAPYGWWQTTAMYVDRQWAESENPADDVGFIRVRPLDGRDLNEVTGARELGFGTGWITPVTVTGYPTEGDGPVIGTGDTIRQSADQMRFDYPRFTGGTSGGPWTAGNGLVIGVIGGYQQGGYTPDISYSPVFGSRIHALYETAAQ